MSRRGSMARFAMVWPLRSRSDKRQPHAKLAFFWAGNILLPSFSPPASVADFIHPSSSPTIALLLSACAISLLPVRRFAQPLRDGFTVSANIVFVAVVFAPVAFIVRVFSSLIMHSQFKARILC